MSRLMWEAFPPDVSCTAPGGHEAEQILVEEEAIPYRVLCPHCAEDWTIVVMAAS